MSVFLCVGVTIRELKGYFPFRSVAVIPGVGLLADSGAEGFFPMGTSTSDWAVKVVSIRSVFVEPDAELNLRSYTSLTDEIPSLVSLIVPDATETKSSVRVSLENVPLLCTGTSIGPARSGSEMLSEETVVRGAQALKVTSKIAKRRPAEYFI